MTSSDKELRRRSRKEIKVHSRNTHICKKNKTNGKGFQVPVFILRSLKIQQSILLVTVSGNQLDVNT